MSYCLVLPALRQRNMHSRARPTQLGILDLERDFAKHCRPKILNAEGDRLKSAGVDQSRTEVHLKRSQGSERSGSRYELPLHRSGPDVHFPCTRGCPP